MNYWLMKSEPTTYSIDDLKQDRVTHWDGVRNYQARNMMRDDMAVGDMVLFYHSNCEPPGIAGIATVASEPYPDFTAFDSKSKYFDAKSSPDNPRWFMVDVKYKRKLKQYISLPDLRENRKLSELQLLKKGNRLSIMPVTKQQWDAILAMEK